MSKISAKMLQKSFDLKKSNLYGGGGTYTTCEFIVYKDNGCKEVTTRTEDDFAELISESVEEVCP